MVVRLLLTAALIAAANAPIPARAQGSNDHSVSFDVASGQEIRMDLSAGEYKIEGAAGEKVRVSWSSKDPYDAKDVKVRFSRDRGRINLETDRTKDTRVIIQVPLRSDLYVRLSAGELHVSGVEGNKDIGLTAGELHVSVGNPAAYKDVESRVRIGEISARPFSIEKDGFFRGFKINGQGKYSLRATVGVGEVVLAP